MSGIVAAGLLRIPIFSKEAVPSYQDEQVTPVVVALIVINYDDLQCPDIQGWIHYG
jgi:hypothetical protein